MGDETREPWTLLTEWRKSRGWTLDDLAAAAGMQKSVISELETGTKRWNRDQVAKLAKAFGIENATDILVRHPATVILDKADRKKVEEYEIFLAAQKAQKRGK